MERIAYLLLFCIIYHIKSISGNADICTTNICTIESSRMLNALNDSVDPCDDFYEFACSKLIRNTQLPATKSSQTVFSEVQEIVDAQIKSILMTEPEPNEPNATKLAKIFTKVCINNGIQNVNGIKPMVEMLHRYGGWPVVEGNKWDEENWNWIDISQKISNDGLLKLILNWGISVDLKNSTRNVLIIDQVELGLPRELLINANGNKILADYYSFMVDSANLFGANITKATPEMLDILRFEIKLAKISMTNAQRKNVSHIYNTMTVQELQANYPYLNWLEYFNVQLQNETQIDQNETVIVLDKSYLQRLGSIMELTPKRTIANYFAWRLVFFGSYLLNDVLDNQRRQHFNMPPLTPSTRLTQCIKKTMNSLPVSVASNYVRNHFDMELKDSVNIIVELIHQEFLKTLQNVPWLGEQSKVAAISKALAMNFDIGFPDELLDDQKLNDYYDGLELHSSSLLMNVMRVNQFYGNLKKRHLRMPIDRHEWTERAKRTTKVDAFYGVSQNTIYLPAAFLQYPIFLANRPSYLNFGSIGWAVAHEITHGFDDHGRKYDPHGNLLDWWNEETISKFNSKAECFIHQYSDYEDPILKLKVNGKRTLDENIADNGAIKGMYAAYQSFVQRNGSDPLLPGLYYTANQLFWISAAQTWCAVTEPSYDQQFYRTNQHTPNRFRIIGSFSNTCEFALDFHCPVGSRMNSRVKCELW